MAGALLTAVAVVPSAADLPVPLVGRTDASWVDTEHVRAPFVGLARDCARPFRYASTASSRVLSGTLLGTSLDPVVQLSGVTATHTGAPGTTSTARPATAPSAGADTYAAPLDVTALSGVAGVGIAAPAVVVLPSASQQVALLQQRSRATSDGEASSATGAVADDGGIRTTPVPTDGTEPPRSAVLDLAALAPGAATLAGLRLEVGALASTAALDGCERDEHGAGPVRAYHVGDLDLLLASPSVGALTSGTASAAAAAQARVTALERQLEQSLKGVGGLAGSTVRVSVAVDAAAAVRPLLGTRLGTGTEVEVDLARGTVRVDLARLLAGSGGLDGRAPGTELVLDAALTAHVAARVDALLQAWATDVQTTLEAALRAARVTVTATSLGLVTLLQVDTTVSELLEGRTRIGLLGVGVDAGTVLAVLTDGLRAGLLGPGGVGPSTGTAVRALVPPVVAATSTATGGLRQAVSLVVNDQRQTVGPTGRTATADVAALRVRVLAGPATTGTAGATELRLSTSSVGPVLERP
ncbi:choice-of-anchor G family protein [Pseudokineococcus basanitobsidens]|uniref:Choice-of-anchor G family protein n=1 Tax=Pseudokineococcus basanitobsidens TaxID=1926649 RepID=A0ABU8RM76_9ACTN